MATSIYKWLLIPFISLCSGMNFNLPAISCKLPTIPLDQVTQAVSNHVRPNPLGGQLPIHPIYVSVTEINHNASDKTLEISCKIFTDDFEKVLTGKYKMKIDLTSPKDKAAMDKIVSDYLQNHLAIKTDGKVVSLMYLGFEREEAAVYTYFQVNNIASVNKIEITNSILHDLYDTQINIMHIVVNGNRKSTKLDFPNTQAVFNF